MALYILWIILFSLISYIAILFLQRKGRKGVITNRLPHIEKLTKIEKNSLLHSSSFIEDLASYTIFFCSIISCIALIAALCTCCVGISPIDPFMKKAFYSRNRSAYLFIIDSSGSMQEPFTSRGTQSKLEVVQKAVHKAVDSCDTATGSLSLLGIDSFARHSLTLVPMTYRRSDFFSQLDRITTRSDSYLNGTATGYALLKALLSIIGSNLLSEKKGKKGVKNITCIILSDGVEDPHPDDRDDPYRSIRLLESLQFAKNKKIIVDYILIKNENKRDISRDEKERLIEAVTATGGKMYDVSREEMVQKAVEKSLNREEKDLYIIPITLSSSPSLLLYIQISCYSIMSIMIIRSFLFIIRQKRKK